MSEPTQEADVEHDEPDAESEQELPPAEGAPDKGDAWVPTPVPDFGEEDADGDQ